MLSLTGGYASVCNFPIRSWLCKEIHVIALLSRDLDMCCRYKRGHTHVTPLCVKSNRNSIHLRECVKYIEIAFLLNFPEIQPQKQNSAYWLGNRKCIDNSINHRQRHVSLLVLYVLLIRSLWLGNYQKSAINIYIYIQ